MLLTAVVRAGSLLACAGLVNSLSNFGVLRGARVTGASTAERVTVCVPARDEEARIAALLTDLRAQTGVPLLRVLVLDDDSADATFAVAKATVDGDARVVVSRRTDGPPHGWLGKPAACHRLAELAFADPHVHPEVLVFLDADVRLAPDAVASGVRILREQQLDLVCPWPSQLAVSPSERLIQPLQQWSWMCSLPLRLAARSQRPSMAAVCGQFLVLDAASYRAVGGHQAVANRVLDDLELARALRRKGFRTAPADGSLLAQCRMYLGGAQLRAGYEKSLWTAFGSSALAATLFTLLAVVYVLPAAAVLSGTGTTRRWGLLGYVAGVGSRLVAARMARTRAWPDALGHPLSVLALAAMTTDSHRRHRSGELYWKGRQLG